MDLVDVERTAPDIPARAGPHPLLVPPLIARDVPDPGGRARPHLGSDPVGIRLLHGLSAELGLDGVLVEVAMADPGEESLPDPGGVAQVQRSAPVLPVVEVPDDGNLVGVGRPDREVSSPLSVHAGQMGPHPKIGFVMPGLCPQILVVLRHRGRTSQRLGHIRHPFGSYARSLAYPVKDGQIDAYSTIYEPVFTRPPIHQRTTTASGAALREIYCRCTIHVEDACQELRGQDRMRRPTWKFPGECT